MVRVNIIFSCSMSVFKKRRLSTEYDFCANFWLSFGLSGHFRAVWATALRHRRWYRKPFAWFWLEVNHWICEPFVPCFWRKWSNHPLQWTDHSDDMNCFDPDRRNSYRCSLALLTADISASIEDLSWHSTSPIWLPEFAHYYRFPNISKLYHRNL